MTKVLNTDLKYKILKNAKALILLTKWKDFRSPNFKEIKTILKFPLIFDGRNQYNVFDIETKGFEFNKIEKNR